MAQVGRKRKPTKLKILAGNPGKRPLPENEPEPAQYKAAPRAPSHLSTAAKKEWRRVVKDFHESGILARIDRAALEAYCETYAIWVKAVENINKTGLVARTTNGNFIQNPYLGIANRAASEMRKWLSELGATPASRSKVQSLKKDDKKEDFFGY